MPKTERIALLINTHALLEQHTREFVGEMYSQQHPRRTNSTAERQAIMDVLQPLNVALQCVTTGDQFETLRATVAEECKKLADIIRRDQYGDPDAD